MPQAKNAELTGDGRGCKNDRANVWEMGEKGALSREQLVGQLSVIQVRSTLFPFMLGQQDASNRTKSSSALRDIARLGNL
jgi:hypothetical protein